ncbi:receptor-type tyrosine-protein phosphatase N2 isoform B [Patagioenas fasciata monilis]|uniref:Receptor-type tyrosine-protein phosphatase N2 isoform B n=1 Tax=Patagioenas fasciata monilis TaxID=372326 RepID=A0A1V4KLI8_PATFA|nr:receptor-type tyrosine-protein phosphatase N2 isoform B [Patagioenas fasciata monilis]
MVMRSGCLFEDDLCKSFEVCVNDGIFGRCQRVPVIDIYKYDISPPVLQRLRIILEKLSHRGFTWRDDYTQHIIGQELSTIHKIQTRRPDIFASEGSDTGRTLGQNAEKERNYNLENDVNLAKSLQQYLKYLGILSQPAATNLYPRKMNDKASVKNYIYNDPIRYYMMQKPKERTSPLARVSTSHQQHAENLHGRTFNQPPPDKFSPESEMGLDQKTLLAAMHTYITQNLSAQSNDKTSHSRTKGSHIYTDGFYSSRVSPFDGSFAKEKADDVKMKVFQPRPASGVLGPTPEILNHKSASLNDPKDPLSIVDETIIKDVLKDLEKHQVNVENLSSTELDEIADTIASAVQTIGIQEETEESTGKTREDKTEAQMKKEGAQGRAETQTGLMENSVNKPDNGVHEASARTDKEDNTAKLVNFLNENALRENMPKDFIPEVSTKTETKKSEDTDSSSAEEINAGVENVKSETFSRELTAAENSEPDSKDPSETSYWIKNALMQDGNSYKEPQKNTGQGLQLEVKSSEEKEYGYIVTVKDPLSVEKGLELIKEVADLLKLQMSAFDDVNVLGPAVTFRVHSNLQNISTADVAKAAAVNKEKLEKTTGLKILQTGVGEKSNVPPLPQRGEEAESAKFLLLTLLSLACIAGVLVASGVAYCLRHRAHHRLKEKLSALGTDTGSDAPAAYQDHVACEQEQVAIYSLKPMRSVGSNKDVPDRTDSLPKITAELCRQRMAVKTSDRPEPLHASRINSVSSQFSDGPIPSPSARSSTSSWCEEPVQSNMDISTGHMILSYMEDHLKNKNRLEKEWEALCAYQAEPNATNIALQEENIQKNRSQAVVPYDHSRICLKGENSHDSSDYINASPIMDHDPRNPAYIATQGPLPATVADFWQMVWENGCVVIVMLTPLAENGVKQCYHYWPDEGSNLYHIYEVNLVSEHIWCEDFLVRSFYLKNLQTNETRTVTQFHFLSWNDQRVPASTRSLLDFRRKVNKCYRGRSCPVVVHCSDGAGRSGTYILIDMVLNKMAKGAKEIDIAATLEHLRDQRPGMVQTKEQFEFALTAVAEEVNAILKALPQ